jgi:hypothetical protein
VPLRHTGARVRRKVILPGHPRFEWVLADPMSRASWRCLGEVGWPGNADAVALSSQRRGRRGREARGSWALAGDRV